MTKIAVVLYGLLIMTGWGQRGRGKEQAWSITLTEKQTSKK